MSKVIIPISVELGNSLAQIKKTEDQFKSLAKNVEKKLTSKIGVDTGSLRAELRQAQNEVNTLTNKFGITSVEAQNAAKRVAGLRDAIGDAKLLTDAFNPDAKFRALGNAVQGAAGAVTALTGLQALFGDKSKEVAETLAKVQGALALTQGLNALFEAKDAVAALVVQFQNLFGGVKKLETLKVSFNGINAGAKAASTSSLDLTNKIVGTSNAALSIKKNIGDTSFCKVVI